MADDNTVQSIVMDNSVKITKISEKNGKSGSETIVQSVGGMINRAETQKYENKMSEKLSVKLCSPPPPLLLSSQCNSSTTVASSSCDLKATTTTTTLLANANVIINNNNNNNKCDATIPQVVVVSNNNMNVNHNNNNNKKCSEINANKVNVEKQPPNQKGLTGLLKPPHTDLRKAAGAKDTDADKKKRRCTDRYDSSESSDR